MHFPKLFLTDQQKINVEKFASSSPALTDYLFIQKNKQTSKQNPHNYYTALFGLTSM